MNPITWFLLAALFFVLIVLIGTLDWGMRQYSDLQYQRSEAIKWRKAANYWQDEAMMVEQHKQQGVWYTPGGMYHAEFL